jgi:hypothetical protein
LTQRILHDEKNLSEDDTSAKPITPALYQSGWHGGHSPPWRSRRAASLFGAVITRGKAKYVHVLYVGTLPSHCAD